jgi:filamentous hemagglutinin
MRPQTKHSNIAAAVRIALLSSCPSLVAYAGGALPIPCPGGVCGAGTPFVSSGSASYAVSGSKGTISQSSTNAILNWQSFNISAGNTVQFVQPSASSVALNQIYDSNPSQIFGALNANGQVFLINQNGIIFGNGASVNVGGLVASTLQISQIAANSGLEAPASTGSGLPAFQAVGTSQGITVQQGATLQTADGGEIYLFAPTVTNLGTIETPDGQTVLAAGTSVFLASSDDPSLRGVVVEVTGNGIVTNGLASNANVTSPQQLVGQIVAQDGNISLAALAVNQYGRLNATTSVNENGSIYLQARTGYLSSASSSLGNTPADVPLTGGTLTMGQNSDTEVNLDATSTTTETDSVAQEPSTIMMSGATIDMLQGSVARATGGVIDVYAAESLSSLGLEDELGTSNWDGGATTLTDTSDGSRVYMAPGSILDVSGASTTLSVTDNVISADLESTELADSPLQRNGPLQGQTIDFDIDAHGTNSDGSTWWGTPLADVEGEILAMGRNVVERNLDGGTVNIQSQGDVILAPNSTIDISGGHVNYTGGYLDTSEVLTLWGQIVPIASASSDIPYAGIITDSSTTDDKWGVTQSYQTTPSYYSPGYVQGYDAGTLKLTSTAFIMDGTVSASTVVGQYQTQPTTAVGSSTWVQETTSGITSYSMYRPYDEVPAGPTLLIGAPTGAVGSDDFVTGNITITPGEVLAGLQNADGSAFDPLTDPLPASFTSSTLQPGLLDGFQNIEIYSNGTVTEAPGVSLSLAPGGNFAVQAASVEIDGGGINVPSGTISVAAESTYAELNDPNMDTDLTLGANASLTATGEWINESTALYPNGNSAPIYIDGGKVSLSVASPGYQTATTSMHLDPGSVIDVSGGAQLTSSGTVNAGTGGSITIDASTSPATTAQLQGSPLPATSLEFGALLRGYGLYDGGSLSISAAGVCIAASNCGAADPTTTLWLTPQFFNSGGFASYGVTADQNGLSLPSGLSLDLIQQNLALNSGYGMQPNAPSIERFTTIGMLPLQQREPVDLTLALYYPANSYVETGGQGAATEASLSFTSTLPSLVVPGGDVISTDPGGSISLASDTAIDVEGTLSAPGGNISLTLGLPSDVSELNNYDTAQAIWLGPDAVLDVSGADEIFPNSVGESTGSVLAGGTVSLNAQIGSLELLPGSVIDVKGTSGAIDIMPVGGGIASDERIASAGGTIELSSAAGGVIGGTLLASAGSAGAGANQPGGGSLYVTDDSSLLTEALEYSGSSGPPNDGVGFDADDVVVSASLTPSVVAPGSRVPDSLLGQTLLSANALRQGGFSIVSLESYLGEIDFTGGASLSATQEVSLDAEAYSVQAGTTASVQAPYVEFGSSSVPYGTSPTTAGPGIGVLPVSGGTGVLAVSGGFIELYGTSALSGIGSASFDSSGDLRVLGLQGDTNVDPSGYIAGGLYADGTIDLTAQQIYPSTLTQFVISADPQFVVPTGSSALVSPPTNGSITVNGSEGTDTDLLSAGGSLTLAAASITQDGVLRAPFGTIALDATSLTLGAGSLTSTSANGLTVPFGTTQGNTGGGSENSYDWVYSLLGDIYAVYGTDGLPPPSQHVELNASNINVQTGAVIDVSGGGNLQAYEWVPGPGGTQDVLDCSDCYAIIPSLQVNVAPYDPAIAASSGMTVQSGAATAGTNALQIGEAVHLSAGSGVPAGTYILLPARYALLPGAYLLTEMQGTTYQDMQPGQAFQVPDGGTIVSGYLTETGTPYGSSRLNGFEVTPSSVFLNYAQYNLTGGNSFFSAQITAATADAADDAASAMRLPQDAGILDLNAGISLTLDGSLEATAANNARGAEVDISNPDIVVAGANSGTNQSGALVLTTSSLDQLGAQTLLLGGENNDGSIDTDAQNITILSGASLTGSQLLLTAQNQISVQSGASITASGTAPATGTLSLEGSGAFLAVSAGPQVTLTASAPSSGTLDLDSGSSLTASKGSIYLDATSGMSIAGNIAATGGNLAVQAPQIALGTAPSGSGAAVLGQNVLQNGDLAGLLLTSSAPIAVYEGGSISAQNVTIDAPGLVSELTTGQSATISAIGGSSTSGTLTLGNSQGTTVTSNGSQAGSLTLSATDIVLQSAALNPVGATTAPTFGIEGFSAVGLDASGPLTAANDIDFSTDGDLSVTAATITTGAGASAMIGAAGSVALLAPSSPETPAAPALGGSLTIAGSSIDLATVIDMPSGDLTLAASGGSSGTGDINVDAGGSIDVAGVSEQYNATTTVATPGGSVDLSATGNIALASGSTINVSAGTGAMGGSVSISAPNGTVVTSGALTGTGAAQGGSFSIDAQSFGSGFGALVAAVNAGGFTEDQSYWLQGSTAPGADNNLTLASGDVLKASTVLLEADQGSIDIEGTIDASGNASGSASDGSGGSVTLSASNDITVASNGVIDAAATAAGENGGTVELDLGSGNPAAAIQLSQGSNINVSGGGGSTVAAGADANVVLPGSGGTVLLRVPYGSVANVSTAPGTITGSSSTMLEAYDQVSASGETDSYGNIDITGTEFSNWQQDAQNIMTSDVPIVAALDASSGLNVTLEPGIEIDAVGTAGNPANITLDTPWDLSQWRFTGVGGTSVAGVLTLRATGGITFDDSLSDGFTNPTSGTLLTAGSGSWSYRIVAGADLNAANPLAIITNASQPAAAVTVGSPLSGAAAVRTGTGFIDVAASGDFVLSNPESVLYTAGEADSVDGSPAAPTCGTGSCRGIAVLPAYAVDGGNIDINVAGNVEGALGTDQFVNDWLWRQGGPGGGGLPNNYEAPVAWSVDFSEFDQGVGALGGGNITVHAGEDIDDFSASIATIGVSTGSGSVDVKGGGTLSVSAGGSILGGSYYVGAGGMTLTAGNSIGPDTANDMASPLIGLGEASVSVTALGNVQIADIVNPTLLSSGASQAGATETNYYSTYGAASSATLTSVGGDVILDDEEDALESQYDVSFTDGTIASTAATVGGAVTDENGAAALDVLPPELSAIALSGDIDVSRDITAFPSSQGNLQLLASGSVNLGLITDVATDIVVPDADPSAMPSIASPATNLAALADVANATLENSDLPYLHGASPLFGAVSSFDENPVQVVALDGDVDFESSAGLSGLWSGKPMIMSAGGDIIDANIVVQNITAGDVTSITAGGQIIYPQTRSPQGGIEENSDGITVAGPGELQVTAGGNVNLGTSAGIISVGNQLNPALPSSGASISVEAGVGASSATAAQYNAFIQQYITGGSDFDGQLVTYVAQITGQTGLTDSEAKQVFAGMTSQQQRTFVEQIFFYLLQTYGTEAVKSGNNADYAGAYAAVQTLFENDNSTSSTSNAYLANGGDISLYFSQIYTDDGGNISLLAPGGGVNAGLAVAPTSYGLTKSPQDLGIVAEGTGTIDSFSYGDFEVNESRVFAADAGDILVWSQQGNIDAGRGSKTSLSAAAPTVTYDTNGFATVNYTPPTTGSGIQALADTPGLSPGTVYLFAPHGVVNAGEAGIVAGNLVVGATQVLGTNNISVSGTTIGVPTTVTGLGTLALSGSAAAAGATTSAQSGVAQNSQSGQQQAPQAAAELRWLDVFVLGFGEQTCSASDLECLKRQKQHPTH